MMRDLPDEVLNLILGNCDYNTLLNLQFVNKRLKNLIQNEVLWMNQCACSMPIFREIIGLNSTNIQPLSMSVCGVQPNKKSLGKYGLSEKGWKSTFLTIHSIKQNKQISKNNGKSKYVRSMLAWGVFYIFLLAIVGFALAGGVMIPFAAEALEKGTRPHSFVSFTFSGVVFSIGISVASISMSIAESECIIALLSLASVFLFLPAMWLDGLMKISFSVPLIPYELLYLALILMALYHTVGLLQ
ncbi:uncharacterized protein MONOS_3191 [Monocercomonoides exilis]|uniref:uncharacterized protein n=1 Tax=Monocercomonoides exilis TaxID=2049356 RepID=UPI00355A149F|nr:hypothetical protein MONOS_3191 [Monocercomonoides exilis]|eukprot:MONOS_3191.1-p1 / transcript=MONOS_3191.1 / gene=MONOS_3191 / organism=Monocercomonoides_exilis_PA203 / gene_product=unspecified product / transcript_product=unspecified product / location=Mono_scaffold00073:30560-31906(-) / protein_length=242 / sequence_SO=supercontig / SO=protein_coding / is_pseudo=false